MRGTRIVVTGVRTIEHETFEIDARTIRPDQVLVRPYYTLISPGTELAIYTGRDPRVNQPGAWCAYPFRPGVIGVGEVIETGSNIHHVRPGEVVYCFPHHASIDYIDASEFLCLPVPGELTLDTCVLARPATIALTAVRLAKPQIGDKVVIFGLGLIGNFAVQLFQLAGCRVLGVDLAPERRQLAERLGRVSTMAPEQLTINALETAFSSRPDIVIDAVGNSSIFADAVRLTKSNGQVILLGTPHDAYQTDLTDLLREIHFKWITVRGALEWCFPPYSSPYAKHSYESNTRMVWNLFRSGALRPQGLITQVISPSGFQAAYEGLLHHKDKFIGVLVKWADS